MNTKEHYKLTSDKVYQMAIRIMSKLPIIKESVRAEIVSSVLMFAAAFRISVNESCQVLESAPSNVTILRELSEIAPDLDSVEKQTNEHFLSMLPKGIGKKGRRVAIDIVKTPYHGTVATEYKDEVIRSQAFSGTTHFFAYATAYVILRGRRYTLALYRVKAGEKMTEVVKKIMSRLRQIKIKVSLLLMDRGFYSVAVISYLINAKQPFIMPAIVRGKKATADNDATGTRALADIKSSCWQLYCLSNADKEEISFEMAIVCRNYNGRYHKHSRETLLYATYGLQHRPLCWVKEAYRSRFGIEASYRQLHQARIKTTSRNPILRFLFVTIALFLRNLWVWLHSEIIALPSQGARSLRPASLPFQRLLLWLFHSVSLHFNLSNHISVPFDFDVVAFDFG